MLKNSEKVFHAVEIMLRLLSPKQRYNILLSFSFPNMNLHLEIKIDGIMECAATKTWTKQKKTKTKERLIQTQIMFVYIIQDMI